MLQALRRFTAAAAIGTGLALAWAAGAGAAVTVTLTPSTASTGTTVAVIASDCAETATASVERTDLNVSMPTKNGQAQGTFVVPGDWQGGTYTVAVKCGPDTASAKLTVTDGKGAATGSGSTASDAATAIALTGAAVAVVAVAGLWLLRRGRVAA